jgi:hypothetical protein
MIWTDIGFYNTLQEARAAGRRAIARCEVLRTPAPSIVKWRDGTFLLKGGLIVGPWSLSMSRTDVIHERLLGVPVKSPRPKRLIRTKYLR